MRTGQEGGGRGEYVVISQRSGRALGHRSAHRQSLHRRGQAARAKTAGGHYRIAEPVVEAFLRTSTPNSTPTARVRTLAIVHHAGGVGKTTTTLNLGHSLARAGYRVLLVDLDPQADLSDRLGLQPVDPTLVDILIAGDGTPTPVPCAWDNGVGFDVIPTSLDQAAFDLRLAGVQMGRERRLTEALAGLPEDQYDFILIDCPPNLSLVTTNGLYAADGVIVPIQAQDKAYRHLPLVLDSVREVQKYRRRESPDPKHPLPLLFGIVVTMTERTVMSREVEEQLRAAYGDVVFHATIPRRTELAIDERHRAPTGVYAPDGPDDLAYRALAEEVIPRAR
jgi:chromosome partitioning protein